MLNNLVHLIIYRRAIIYIYIYGVFYLVCIFSSFFPLFPFPFLTFFYRFGIEITRE